MRVLQKEEAMVEVSLEQLWDRCGLGKASSAEDVDRCLDMVLDVTTELRDKVPAVMGQRLAELLGVPVDTLKRVAGVDELVPEVSFGHYQLMNCAMVRCLEQAEAVSKGAAPSAFLQAVAVVACAQFEVLGDVAASDQSFAVMNWGQKLANDFAMVLLKCAGVPSSNLLVLVRNFVRTKELYSAEVMMLDAILLPVEAVQQVSTVNQKRVDDAQAVLGLCEGMIDAFAVAYSSNRNRESDQQAAQKVNSYGAQLIAAFAQNGGGSVAATLSYFAHRQELYRKVRKGVSATASSSLAADLLEPEIAQQVWRDMACIPALQVVAPVLAAPSHLQTRIGPSEEVDAQVLPLLRRVSYAPEVQGDVMAALLSATAVVCVLAHLSDAGYLTGRMPEGKLSHHASQHIGRLEDTLRYGQYVLPFDRKTRVGQVLAIAADLGLALSFLDPISSQAASASISPLGWLSLPLCDDIRFDLALSAVLTVLPLLDEGTCQSLSSIVQLLRSSQDETRLQAFEKLLSKQGVEISPNSNWDSLFARVWSETAGLSLELPDRVNAFGKHMGFPRGGAFGVSDNWSCDDGLKGTLAQVMSELDVSFLMPSRYLGGHLLPDRRYWRHAEKRGEMLEASLSELLEKSDALSQIFTTEGDGELRDLIVSSLAMQADDLARQTYVAESCGELGFLGCV